MDDEKADIVTAWQDANLATELAERLAKAALAAEDAGDPNAAEAKAIADLADLAAHAAGEVAVMAREAAVRARTTRRRPAPETIR